MILVKSKCGREYSCPVTHLKQKGDTIYMINYDENELHVVSIPTWGIESVSSV